MKCTGLRVSELEISANVESATCVCCQSVKLVAMMATGCTVLQYTLVAPSVVGAHNTFGGHNVQYFIPQLGLVLQYV